MEAKEAKREGSSIVESGAWHALDPSAVVQALETRSGGLTSTEAKERLARFGPNRVEPPPPTSPWSIFLRQFRSPL